MGWIKRLKRYLLRWWGWQDARELLEQDGARLELDGEQANSLQQMAQQQQRSQGELVAEFIHAGLTQRAVEKERAQELERRWAELSRREQQVIALICRGYSNAQISFGLNLAVSTVKVYARQAYAKLGVHNRAQLRVLFSGWDFSAWD